MSCRDTSMAARLNRDCDCAATDLPALTRHFDPSIIESHPHLFSDAGVFLEPAHVREMQGVIDAVHAIAALPGYVESALAAAPDIARERSRAAGVFAGFDFHITENGPKLIEINTNAGGALLNAAARRAQPECCPGADEFLRPQPDAATLESRFIAMFLREWELARGPNKLRTIAIVDDEPVRQYLYPEFLLFRRLFEAHGIEAVIADASSLECENGVLTAAGRRIDLAYNRVTDFQLNEPAHAALRRAYETDAAVVTPHPRAHALLANKRNLALLTDRDWLMSIGARGEHIGALQRAIPRTLLVEGAEEPWWAGRKSWFFKPVDGFGSRGAYRGDKLTRRVFAEVMQGRYVAQEFAPPGERWRATATGRQAFKVDIRNYVYDGATLLIAARLYQGQTTNFRTAGGGFAPVYESRG